ncbi:hypothetical protein PtB15_6B164 [Puccinia triticina]|nr:hypothetical protein PtB15_6B164 [Puccinia triticina]
MSNPNRRSHRQATREGKSKQKSIDTDYGEENSEEDALEELTRPQLLEINRVFDTIISGNSVNQQPTHGAPKNKTNNTNSEEFQNRKSTSPGDHGGGFLVENQDQFESSQGGFLTEEAGADVEAGGFLIDQTNAQTEGGGFITEETGVEVEGGGFLREEAGPDSELDESINQIKPKTYQSLSLRKVSNYIGIRQIPNALKMLNLPYRNREILDIFENAASSDEDDRSDEQVRSTGAKQKLISRLKFSKVCAVLMIANGNDDNSGIEEMDETGAENRRRERVEEDGDYSMDQDSSDQASSASDYQPACPKDGTPSSRYRTRRGAKQSLRSKGTSTASECDAPDLVLPKARPKRRQAKGKKPRRFSEAEDEEDEGEVSMQSAALETFALFLQPTTMNSDVRRTIGFEEIRRAADQLGETISDEEIKEMLNYASYTNNYRVTFQAFEKLMKEIRTV